MKETVNWVPGEIGFRPLAREGLPLLYKWLNDPYLVGKWLYGSPISYREVEKKYLPKIKGEEPTIPYVIFYGNVPIGYVQSYMWKDYPEYLEYLRPCDESASSLDIFIAEKEYRGKGIGVLILKIFLREKIFSKYDTKICIITPLVGNNHAIRAYEKAGFRKDKIIEPPSEPSPVQVMSIRKSDLG